MLAYIKGICNSILSYLGFFNKKVTVIFLGLDNAGKSALLYVLKYDKTTQTKPTNQPTSEELRKGNTTLNAFDLGGHETARKIWKDYYPAVNAILFLIDSTDVKRFPEAKKELCAVLDSPELVGIPVVILGNKIDMIGAVAVEELKDAIGYEEIKAKDTRPIELFMTSVMHKLGYSDALNWLDQQLPA